MWKIIEGDNISVTKTMDSNSVHAVVCDPPYGLSFMGRKWDYSLPDPGIWAECLRVLKPGGFLFSFSGARTYHRLVIGIEDAGFTIHPLFGWIYGQGFPKGADVSKAIDKKAGAEREVVGKHTNPAKNKTYKTIFSDDNYQWIKPDGVDITAPATESAKHWEGYKYGLQAIKPALEPIALAQKPFDGKPLDSIVKWEVGAFDVDGCRIPLEGIENHKTEAKSGLGRKGIYGKSTIDSIKGKDLIRYTSKGRYPANLLLDPVGAESLGEVARFYYCAKASPGERNAGLDDRCNHPTVKPIKLMRWLVRLVTREGQLVLDPFCGSGSTGIAAVLERRDFIGIDISKEYCDIAHRRISHWEKED